MTRTFFQFIKTYKKKLTIKIPYYEYLRGQVFVEDMKIAYGDKVPTSFNIAELIYMLYDDFLFQVQTGGEHEIAAKFLANEKRSLGQNRKKAEKKILRPISTNVFSFEYEEIEEVKEEQMAYLEILIKEQELYRGEVLLHDLEPYLENELVMVEDVFAIMYLDFIQRVKKLGNSHEVKSSIQGILYKLNN